MFERSTPPWLRLLSHLRWLAVVGQSATVLLVTAVLQVELPLAPIWSGIGALALFNVYAMQRARGANQAGDAEVFTHMLVDIAVLGWLVAWSGGIENPFSSLFLLPIALSILALHGRWIWATAVASVAGFALAALLAVPLPHVHGAFGDAFDLHKLGMLVTFAVSVAVVLIFFTRMASAWRQSEREVAALRERFARDEGIVALATHAASVAHELNTPLGTLTLMVEDMAADADGARGAELATLRALIDDCRDRVRELASPADRDGDAGLDLDRVIARWQLVRPTVDLRRSGSAQGLGRLDPAVGHLIQALLNNAADASSEAGQSRVDLHIEAAGQGMSASIRDYGSGLRITQPLLPATLFRTSKPDGMGIGLALSHATVERLGGTLSMQAANEGPGVVVSFRVPVVNA
jgi:two-component system sensor histidine kinase RegB